MAQCSHGRDGKMWRESLQMFLLDQWMTEYLLNVLKKYPHIEHAPQNLLTPTLRDDLEASPKDSVGVHYVVLKTGDW